MKVNLFPSKYRFTYIGGYEKSLSNKITKYKGKSRQ